MTDPLFVSRDEIADQAALIVDYAVMMGDFARVGDDHGVAYTYRKTLAHMRMVAAALQLIIAAHNADPARRQVDEEQVDEAAA